MNKTIVQAQAEALIRATKHFTGKNIKHSEALDILSVLYQFNNYNELANYIKAETAFAELDDMEKTHAEDNLDTVYENECVIATLNGRKLCVPAYPEECSYVRVVDRANHEIMYWNYEEWQESPQDVMGAFIGALNGGVHRKIPQFLQEMPIKNKKKEHFKVLEKPLSNDARKNWVEGGEVLNVVLAISPEEYQLNIEEFNDLVEEKILGDDKSVVLSEDDQADIYLQDMSYKIVGFDGTNLLVNIGTYFDLMQY